MSDIHRITLTRRRLTRAVGRARTVARPPIPPAGWEAYRACACAYCAHVRGGPASLDPRDGAR